MPTTAKEKQRGRELLERLAAYGRNVGAASIEEMARELAKLLEVELEEESIERRRKP